MDDFSTEWIEIDLEVTREMSFKSDQNMSVMLNNVTHYKRRDEVSAMLKCDEGIFYFQIDDVSWIKSKCKDWVV